MEKANKALCRHTINDDSPCEVFGLYDILSFSLSSTATRCRSSIIDRTEHGFLSKYLTKPSWPSQTACGPFHPTKYPHCNTRSLQAYHEKRLRVFSKAHNIQHCPPHQKFQPISLKSEKPKLKDTRPLLLTHSLTPNKEGATPSLGKERYGSEL